jgi:Iap family predicted aminopeptidase
MANAKPTVPGQRQGDFSMTPEMAQRFQRMTQLRRINDLINKEEPALILSYGARGSDGTIFVQGGGQYTPDSKPAPASVVISSDEFLRVQRLLEAKIPVTIEADVRTTFFTDDTKGYNVIAEIPGTDPKLKDEVVMVGAHLDSVAEGPGINDNGSGVAAVLETAVQLGSAPTVKHAVRFGFWGAEELGIVGSKHYIESLNVDQLKDIALYLNFDMIGSPNPGYFTYDGDQSTALEAGQGPPRVPEGSPGIERTLVAYLASVGKAAQDTSFDGRSDYDGFTMAGIPSGGLFTGAEEKMTAE